MFEAVLDLITGAPGGPRVVGWTVFGVAWQLLTVLLVRRAALATSREAGEIATMARSGLRDRARIRARESAHARPLLELLSGEMEARAGGTISSGAHYAALVLPLVGVLAWLQTEDSPYTFFAWSLGLAILLPSTMITARAVTTLHGAAERDFRQAALPLLETNARRSRERASEDR
ncbi:MAG: hypothetical protein AAFU79_04430 [Myxococcota bacterium]